EYQVTLSPEYVFSPGFATFTQAESLNFTAVNITCGVFTLVPIGAGEVKAGALATTDCTSPIRGTSFFADRYSFSGMAGEEVVISTRSAVQTSELQSRFAHVGRPPLAQGGVVARIP